MHKKLEHEKKVLDRLKHEDEIAERDTDAVRRHVLHYLKDKKGYPDDDIEIDGNFDVSLCGRSERASVDFIIKASGRRLFAIMCSNGSVESRERHVLSFSRAADEYMIPVCAVTDGETTRVFDSHSGRLLSESIDYIPHKAKLDISSFDLIKCPEDRAEREKRILLAFESVSRNLKNHRGS